MKPWQSLGQEVAGAWRSVRYDIDHRSKAGVESKSRLWPIFGLRSQTRPIDPDATAILGQVRPERESIWSPLRNPRRLMATMAVASGIAASATGTFFAVSGGLGILLVDSHSTPTPPPTVPTSAPQVVAPTTPDHHPVSASRRPSPSASARASATASASASARVSPAPNRSAEPAKPSPSGTITTTSPSASPTPDGTPSATVSHTSSPNATPTASPTP